MVSHTQCYLLHPTQMNNTTVVHGTSHFFSSGGCKHASTHFAYPRRDGQAELAMVVYLFRKQERRQVMTDLDAWDQKMEKQ